MPGWCGACDAEIARLEKRVAELESALTQAEQDRDELNRVVNRYQRDLFAEDLADRVRQERKEERDGRE